MPAAILTTKLHIPSPRPGLVMRPHLVERLTAGLAAGRTLTLISASAGFGKTTLLSEWISDLRLLSADYAKPSNQQSTISNPKFSWLSLDAADSNLPRFLTYFIAALQTIQPPLGKALLTALQTPRPPSGEAALTALLNEIAAIPEPFVLILDDYHLIDSPQVDQSLEFLVAHQPPQMHLVIASRQDPPLPLARLRARGQLNELRAADLRFTPSEAAEFLNRVMGLHLADSDVIALETRTEGWIAGLQLAAIALQSPIARQSPVATQGEKDIASFIQSFTGGHHFVLDYLLEEVLHRQPESVQNFLLRTSILDRLCGPLCEALLDAPANSGQETIDGLERANLFIIPLDNERRWYRYHHLFGELLRKRLGQKLSDEDIAALHIRASAWHEKEELLFDAFRYAAAANDVERAERLTESRKIGLHLRSVAIPIIEWLASLPKATLDEHPRLWVRSATLSLVAGQTTGVEERLQAAEAILQTPDPDPQVRDLLGQIACARATLALTRYDPPTMMFQAHRALEYLHPNNLTFRFTANWALTAAYLFQGNRAAAAKASLEGIAISQQSGDVFSRILATSTLGLAQELDNQLFTAAETYQRALALFGEYPLPNAEEALLGLARIHYEWNDLAAAEAYGQRALQQARMYDRMIDRFIISEVFLARLKLAQGDGNGAAAMLAQTEQTAHQKNFLLRLPDVAAAQVLVLIAQGSLPAAAQLARQFELPLAQARVLLAEGDFAAALAIIEPYRQQMETRGWADERLRAIVLQAIALSQSGAKDKALAVLAEALSLAEPSGFIRLFVDEGEGMRLLMADYAQSYRLGRLLIERQPHDHKLFNYADKLLAAFPSKAQSEIGDERSSHLQSEILTSRELEIIQLIADGLTNEAIATRLYLSLYTVKAHVRNIFAKLDVANRTRAVARARELGILQRS
jgi:LuxR family maltose regulon positive regulatory protein